MLAPPASLEARRCLYFVRASAPEATTISGMRTAMEASASTRKRPTTYGTTAMTPSLSDAYGVSCRARAERAALGLVLSPFAPGHDVIRRSDPWFPRSP